MCFSLSSAGLQHDFDVLAHQSTNQGVHAPYRAIQIQAPRLDRLPPAESEELTDQRGPAFRRILNLRQVSAFRIVWAAFVKQHLGERRDRGQQVVEVVGHSVVQMTSDTLSASRR
jgi:hypothetical protein